MVHHLRFVRYAATVFVVSSFSSVSAHRPMINGVSCGAEYATAETALQVHDITIEWSGNRVVKCGAPAFWVKYDVPQSQVGKQLYISAGTVHPESNSAAARFSHQRIDAILLGPGQPILDRSEIPDFISVPSNMQNGIILESPDDISTCDHSEWMRPMGVLDVEDGICTFFERFTRTNLPVVLDKTPVAMAAGTHHAAVWIRGHQTGKVWFAVGVVGGKEDFMSSFPIPRGSCDCGDNDDFNEQGRVLTIPLLGGLGSRDAVTLPEVASCSPLPSEDWYCVDGATGPSAGTATTGPATTPSGTATSVESNLGSMTTAPTPSDMQHGGSGSSGGSGTSMDHSPMSMGCGKLEETTSVQYIQANMDMHTGMAVQFSCNVALDFISGMIPHHQGAVDMCEIVLNANQYTDSGIVHFCQHVQLEQGIEMRIMNDWVQQRGLQLMPKCGDPESMGCGNMSCHASREWIAANERMHKGMAIQFIADAEVDFMRGMIPHHRGAIEMCEILDLYGASDMILSELCANITRTQRAEIMWMSEWLKKKNAALELTCEESSPSTEPCEDLLPISEACHTLGGDRGCKCTSLAWFYECDHVGPIQGREMNISDFCRRTCDLCPDRVASPVGRPSTLAEDGIATTNAGHEMASGSRRILVLMLSFVCSHPFVA